MPNRVSRGVPISTVGIAKKKRFQANTDVALVSPTRARYAQPGVARGPNREYKGKRPQVAPEPHRLTVAHTVRTAIVF